jgi:cell shape-determining protein MreC
VADWADLQEGVVGHVQAVSPFQSVVQLVTDRRSRVPARDRRSDRKH